MKDKLLIGGGILIAVLVVLFLIGTFFPPSDDKDILHFNEQDVSVENYRAYVRTVQRDNPVGFEAICKDIAGLSREAGLNYFRNGNPDDSIPSIAGGTPRPGQKSDDDSMKQAVGVVQDECKRS